MKPFTKTANKWILSTLMIAALGSQYYFSVSSNTSGHFELSSTAAEELADKLKELKSTPNLSEAEHAKRKHELLVQYNKLITAENETIKKAPVVKVAAEPVAAPAPKDGASVTQTIELEPKLKMDPNFMGPPAPTALMGPPAPSAADLAKATAAPAVTAVKSVTATVTAPAAPAATVVTATTPAVPKKSDTEGKTYKIICKECNEDGYVIISKTNEQTAIQLASFLNGKAATQATSTPEVKVEAKPVAKAEPTKEEQCASEETSLERSRCIREKAKEEREEKKRLAQEAKDEKKQAKLDKEQEKRELRNDKFEEKASAIADSCHDDLRCKTTKLTALMNSFKGSNKVDQFTVMKAYNELVAGDLKSAISSADGKSLALQTIESMMSQIPSEYRDVKKRAVDTAKAGQISKAESVNTLYKQSEELKNKKQYIEAAQLFGQARVAETTLRRESDEVYFTMRDGLSSSNDNSTWDYVTNTYLPDLKNVMGRLSNVSGLAPDSSSAINSALGTSSGNRGGRTGNTTNINNGSASVGSSNSLNGVKFGTQSGQRTTTRTGVNLKE